MNRPIIFCGKNFLENHYNSFGLAAVIDLLNNNFLISNAQGYHYLESIIESGSKTLIENSISKAIQISNYMNIDTSGITENDFRYWSGL